MPYLLPLNNNPQPLPYVPGQVIRVAITGGIGSGKTTVADILAAEGCARIEADQVAAEVLQEKTSQVATLFQLDLGPDQSLDKKQLAQIVFADPQKRQQLEALIHPEVARRVETFFAQLDPQLSPVGIYSVPLLAENPQAARYHCIITVSAPEEKRFTWLEKRSQLSPAQVKARIKSQASAEARRAISDYELVNDGSLAELAECVRRELLPLLTRPR